MQRWRRRRPRRLRGRGALSESRNQIEGSIMKRLLTATALLTTLQIGSLMVSCGKAEPIAGGTGGSAAWECLTTCMGVTSLMGFDTCAEVEAANCGSGGTNAGGGSGGANAMCSDGYECVSGCVAARGCLPHGVGSCTDWAAAICGYGGLGGQGGFGGETP